MIFYSNNKRGFALLLSMLVSSVVLAIGVSILHVSVSQINLASTARESEIAFSAAHAGVDCMWFWRYTDVDYTGEIFSVKTPRDEEPPVTCFQAVDDGSDGSYQTLFNNSNGETNLYEYEFAWGPAGIPEDRCTQVDLYIMHPTTGNPYAVDFEAYGISDAIGSKTCEDGSTCTVLISRGYNRACGEISTSIFALQREITVEF